MFQIYRPSKQLMRTDVLVVTLVTSSLFSLLIRKQPNVVSTENIIYSMYISFYQYQTKEKLFEILKDV